MEDPDFFKAPLQFVSNGPSGILHHSSSCYRMQRRYGSQVHRHSFTLDALPKRRVCEYCVLQSVNELSGDPDGFYTLTNLAMEYSTVQETAATLVLQEVNQVHELVRALRQLVSDFDEFLATGSAFYDRVKVMDLFQSAQLMLDEYSAKVKDMRPEIIRRAAAGVVAEPSRFGKGSAPSGRAAVVLDAACSYHQTESARLFSEWASVTVAELGRSERCAALKKIVESVKLEDLAQLAAVQTVTLPGESVLAAAARCWRTDRDRLAAQMFSRWDRAYAKIMKSTDVYVVAAYAPQDFYMQDEDLFLQVVDVFTQVKRVLNANDSVMMLVPAAVGAWLELSALDSDYSSYNEDDCVQLLNLGDRVLEPGLLETAITLWDPTLPGEPYASLAVCLDAARALA
jgi:hypothetical protein